jgi:hypothetical protein
VARHDSHVQGGIPTGVIEEVTVPVSCTQPLNLLQLVVMESNFKLQVSTWVHTAMQASISHGERGA